MPIFNLGNVGGAWLGGAALSASMTYHALPWLGAALSVVSLTLTAVSMTFDRRAAEGAGRALEVDGK